MSTFEYRDGIIHAEDVPVTELADKYGTPLYVYSRNHFRAQYNSLKDAMADVSPLICYSVKANPNASVVRTFIEEGAGLDIVSGGELYRGLAAGADPSKIVFAGVGKTREEIEYALKQQILFFTVESEPEAIRISECAQKLGVTGRIAFRVNPDVDPKTHEYTTTGKKENKFGMDVARVEKACSVAASLPNLELAGLHMHIGSQILTVEPFAEAVTKVSNFCSRMKTTYPSFKYLDIGGGVGIKYEPGQRPVDLPAFADAVVPPLKKLGLSVVMEPGRFLAGNGGVMVCRVQYVKENEVKKFIISDGAMNDLLRPSLYGSYHEIVAVKECAGSAQADLVGPICESGDFFAQGRELPTVEEGDLLMLKSAGAYGFAMASTYNSRPRPAEVMVDGSQTVLVRERETWEDLVRGEKS